MRIALCNEVIRHFDFAAQCEMAAKLGYDGLEVAPFTLSDEPHLLSAARRLELRRAATDAGISITGLHWLLIKPEGLHVTTPVAEVRARTIDVIERLIGLCADLGGGVLVHGSPKQRCIPPGERLEAATEPRHRSVLRRRQGRRAGGRGLLHRTAVAPRNRLHQHGGRGGRVGRRDRIAVVPDHDRHQRGRSDRERVGG